MVPTAAVANTRLAITPPMTPKPTVAASRLRPVVAMMKARKRMANEAMKEAMQERERSRSRDSRARTVGAVEVSEMVE